MCRGVAIDGKGADHNQNDKHSESMATGSMVVVVSGRWCDQSNPAVSFDCGELATFYYIINRFFVDYIIFMICSRVHDSRSGCTLCTQHSRYDTTTGWKRPHSASDRGSKYDAYLALVCFLFCTRSHLLSATLLITDQHTTDSIVSHHHTTARHVRMGWLPSCGLAGQLQRVQVTHSHL